MPPNPSAAFEAAASGPLAGEEVLDTGIAQESTVEDESAIVEAEGPAHDVVTMEPVDDGASMGPVDDEVSMGPVDDGASMLGAEAIDEAEAEMAAAEEEEESEDFQSEELSE